MNIIAILAGLAKPDVILALVVGVVGGVIIGALPGLSATMGVALLIPVTFSMSPTAGLVLLVSVYCSAIYGGSISAILLHTPGTPASAATAIDGYELTKKGQSLKALGVATISSGIGGAFSALALLLIAPPLAKISLSFSALEYFFLGIFGLSIIGGLAGDSMVKGIMSGIIGLFIGLIGLDMINGIPRYTFGILNLESGIQLVPAMIGMFSISEVLHIATQIAKGSTSIVDDPSKLIKGKFLPTKKEFKKITPSIIRSSIIGLFIGILPGAGSDIGSWLSYNEAKRVSKDKEEFGQGSIEGLAASEAGNNSVVGGALIPLLTLGIPGSGVAAVLLGGLLIQGLVPGHELFSKHADVTYTVIFGFFIANILMCFFGYFISKYAVKVTTVPMAVLAPMIVAFSAVGSYAISNSIFDVWVMLIFGLIGYVMRITGFDPAPALLGVILTSLIEANFRRSLILARGSIIAYFFRRPISVVIFILIVLTLATPGIMKIINKRKAKTA